LSGIGKSSEVNGLLLEFLPHLGEEGWPKEVWYRYDDKMLKYSIYGRRSASAEGRSSYTKGCFHLH
jgi:hypothetical protein